MKLKLIDIDDWAKELKEVTSYKMFENGKLSKNGLFSQQIFGPLKSYCCACNRSTYRGRNFKSNICPGCGVKITSSSIRRSTFAKIELPFPILNPIFYFLMGELKQSSISVLNNMLEYKHGYYFNKKRLLCPYVDGIDSEEEKLIGLNGALKYISELTKDKQDNISKFISNNFKSASIRNVIVIPPGFRPCNQNSSGVYISDKINKRYSDIIRRSNLIKDVPMDFNEKEEIHNVNFKNIQKITIELYKYTIDKLSKKNGLVRSNILGKRVDFSGRAVISPDPTLKMDECRIPYFMILEMYKPQLTTYLISRRVGKRYNAVVSLIDEHIKNKDTSLLPYIEDFCVGKLCVLNRQPTLHRLGMLGFKITPHFGDTIKIHPMVCSPYNADFDGDCLQAVIEFNVSGQIYKMHIKDLEHCGFFEKYESKNKDNGIVIQKYKPIVDNISILSIDPNSGKIQNKRIREYSIHDNVRMFDISDTKNRFNSFKSSNDHSMIIYDESTKKICKMSPEELLKNPENKFLIRKIK